MIARVRIAPVEQWCEHQIQYLKREGLTPDQVCGQEIEIETSRIYEDPHCHGKLWLVHVDSANKMRANLHKAPDEIKSYLCEHQLEMD